MVQKEVPAAKRGELTSQLMDEHVVRPFLECIKLLIEKGADPHAQVQKLKRARDLDEERRKLAMVKEATGQQATRVRELEGAKRREEVLKEREVNKRGPLKAKKRPKFGLVGSHLGGPGGLGQPGAPKRVEEEYHATMGL